MLRGHELFLCCIKFCYTTYCASVDWICILHEKWCFICYIIACLHFLLTNFVPFHYRLKMTLFVLSITKHAGGVIAVKTLNYGRKFHRLVFKGIYINIYNFFFIWINRYSYSFWILGAHSWSCLLCRLGQKLGTVLCFSQKCSSVWWEI